MYSKRNCETKQRYTIKKFKVGAASVLVATLFVGFVGQIKAETYQPIPQPEASGLVNPPTGSVPEAAAIPVLASADETVKTETKKITRTINYVKPSLNYEPLEAAKSFVTEVEYTRKGKLNPVSGQTDWEEWVATNGDNILEGHELPEVPGYEYESTRKQIIGEVNPDPNKKEERESTIQDVVTNHDTKSFIETVTFTPIQKNGDVVVKYVKTGTNENLKEPVEYKKGLRYTEEYDTKEKHLPEIKTTDNTEYVFDKLAENSDPENGIITKPVTEIIYEYKEKDKGSVVVNYVDEKGRPIEGAGDDQKQYKSGLIITDNVYVGTEYNTTDHKPKTITTKDKIVYTLVPNKTVTPKEGGQGTVVDGKPAETGQVTKGTTTVTYVYKKVTITPKPDKSEIKSGWMKENGVWFFYKEDVKATSWVKDAGKWYFLNEKGEMQTGWVKDADKWYFLNENGEMKTGWVKDNGTWYFLTGSGAMATGWAWDAGKWYYLKSNGAMVSNAWVKDNGTWYFLKFSGAMAVSEMTPDGYKVNASGAWVK